MPLTVAGTGLVQGMVIVLTLAIGCAGDLLASSGASIGDVSTHWRSCSLICLGASVTGERPGTVQCVPALPSRWCAPQMEDSMCYSRDYKIFDDVKKAEDTRVSQERRAGMIDSLLKEANKSGEKTKPEAAPVKDVVPAT